MPKRYGDLFHKIVDPGNLMFAHKNASRGKSHYREVIEINKNPWPYINQIREALLQGSFRTSEYEVFDRFDGRKTRTIYKLPYFPDRIVQHAIVQICGPIWESSFIRDTYQSIPGRGPHDAKKRVQGFLDENPGMFVYKFDIRKYYPSINTVILKSIVHKKIKCSRTLALIFGIIDSLSGLGLAIGNYISQHLGNLFLTPFDWWVKQVLRPAGYFRYCDDMVLFGKSSHKCHEMRKTIEHKLDLDFDLSIKSNWQVFPIDKRPLDFVGFVFDGKSVRLRKSIAQGVKHKHKRIARSHHLMTPFQIANGSGSGARLVMREGCGISTSPKMSGASFLLTSQPSSRYRDMNRSYAIPRIKKGK